MSGFWNKLHQVYNRLAVQGAPTVNGEQITDIEGHTALCAIYVTYVSQITRYKTGHGSTINRITGVEFIPSVQFGSFCSNYDPSIFICSE